jgi:hypothetical protein
MQIQDLKIYQILNYGSIVIYSKCEIEEANKSI